MLLYSNDYCFEISVSLSLVHKLRKAIKGFTFILFSPFFIFYILPFQCEMTKNTTKWTHFHVCSKACGSRRNEFNLYAYVVFCKFCKYLHHLMFCNSQNNLFDKIIRCAKIFVRYIFIYLYSVSRHPIVKI